MQVGVAKYVNSVSKAGMTTGLPTGRHTDRHVWTPFEIHTISHAWHGDASAVSRLSQMMLQKCSKCNIFLFVMDSPGGYRLVTYILKKALVELM